MGFTFKIRPRKESSDTPGLDSMDQPPSYSACSSQTPHPPALSAHARKSRKPRPHRKNKRVDGRPPRLQKPIAIPAARPGHGANFLRAYPPILASYDISKSQFLKFLDQLNAIKLDVSPQRVLGRVAGGLGYVRASTAQILTPGLAHTASATRAEMLIREINKEVFEPRGLKMEIANFEGLVDMAGVHQLFVDRLKLGCHRGLLGPVLHTLCTHNAIVKKRRMQYLKSWVGKLKFIPLRRKSVPLKKWEAKAASYMQTAYKKEARKRRFKATSMYQRRIVTARNVLEKRLSELQAAEENAGLKYASDVAKFELELECIALERAHVIEEYCENVQGAEENRKSHDEEDLLRKLLFLTIRNLDSISDSDKGSVL